MNPTLPGKNPSLKLSLPRFFLHLLIFIAFAGYAQAQTYNSYSSTSPYRDGMALAFDAPNHFYLTGGVAGGLDYGQHESAQVAGGSTFQSHTAMSVPRAWGKSVVGSNGQAYYIGGEVNGVVTSTVESYDPVNNVWIARSPLPAAMSRFAAVAYNDLILVAGGGNGTITSSTVFAYHVPTDQWQPIGSMSQSRQDLQAGVMVVSGTPYLYTVGGMQVPGSPASITNLNERFNLTNFSRQTMAPMPQGLARFMMGTDNDVFKEIHAMAGQTNTGALNSTGMTYSTHADSWYLAFGAGIVGLDRQAFGYWDLATFCEFTMLSIGGTDASGNPISLWEEEIIVVGPTDGNVLQLFAEASSVGTGVDLRWQEPDLETVHRYRLERAGAHRDFEQVCNEIQAMDADVDHRWQDTAPVSGLNHYRLSALGADGATILSSEVFYTHDLSARTARVFPNPSAGEVFLNFESNTAEEVRIQIYSIKGELLKETQSLAQEGSNTIQLDVPQLPNGRYLVKVGGSQPKVLKLMIAR